MRPGLHVGTENPRARRRRPAGALGRDRRDDCLFVAPTTRNRQSGRCRELRPPISSDHPVLVNEPIQTVGSSYPGGIKVADGGRGRIAVSGRSLIEGPLRPVRVVMPDLLCKDCVEVAAEDEHPIEVDHPLADGVV
jgi:hypothetical protein